MLHRLYLTLVLLMGTGTLVLLDQWYRAEIDLENQRYLNDAATAVQSDLTHAVQGLVEAVSNLQAFMLAGDSLPEPRAFDRFSANLHALHPELEALVYVGPDRRIQLVFPLERHQRALGVDLSQRPSAPFVEKAIVKRRIVVDSPHRIIGGELAIVVRAPLYRGDDLQGLAQGVVNIASLTARLDPWTADYSFNLRDQNGELFWGAETLPGAVQHRILSVGDTTWTLGIGREAELSRSALFTLLVIWVAGSALVGVVAYQVHRMLNHTRVLNEAVASQTRALAESERKYRALMENASDAILVVGEKGLFVDVNHRAVALLGYTEQELLRLGPPDIHPPEEQERLRSAFQDMERGGSSRYEHLVLTREGRTLPVEVVGTRIDLGETRLYVGHFRDISKRRRIEKELHSHRHELERLVDERTRELQAANQELEAFSYSVSHDLRAPLRAINGFGEVLREDYADSLDALAHTYLDRMQNAALRMSELIDGLLNLSRVFRTELTLDEVDLSRLAGEVCRLLQEGEPDRVVELSIASDLTATGDETLLRLLLQNLLGNAWKFTANQAAPRIEFGAERHGARTIFHIRDNGAGFEMEYAHKLFKPFERLHTEADYAGTGIGLATVRRIIQRHGGEVWAEGAPNHGATVYFTLGTGAAE